MTPTSRRILLLCLMGLVATAFLAAWNVSWMRQQHDAARQAHADLLACRAHARAIEALRDQPTVASTQTIGARELAQRSAEARTRAKLNEDAIKIIDPQKPRQLGDSPYRQMRTALALRGVSVPQLATFLYHLTENLGLTVRDLRLRTPHGETADDRWDADVTLTCLVYDPTQSRPNDL